MHKSACSKLMVYTVCLMVLLASAILAADQSIEQYTAWVQKANIPDLAKEVFTEKKFNEKYEIAFHINPFYLRGDFNGNNRNDVAVLIKEKSAGKIGIAIIHDGKRDVFIVGAGTAVGNGGPDFKWMDVWSVHPKGTVQSPEEAAPLKLNGEGLSVVKGESASGLIYWDGKKYKWYQMTD